MKHRCPCYYTFGSGLSYGTDEGLDRLLGALEQLGMEGDDFPAADLRVTLTEMRRRGWNFDQAWDSAINRLQPSQIGGVVDARLDQELRESRRAIEETRPIFKAAYGPPPMRKAA